MRLCSEDPATSDGPYLNDLKPSEVLVPQLFGCIHSILDPSAGNTSHPGDPVGVTPAVGLTLPFFSPCMHFLMKQLTSQLASEIAARTLAFFQKGGICYGTHDPMGVWLVMTSLGTRFSVLSWRTSM